MKLSFGDYCEDALAVRQRYFLSEVFEVQPLSYAQLIEPISNKIGEIEVMAFADELCKHVLQWRRRWHLNDPWCIELALNFLLSYNNHRHRQIEWALLSLLEWFVLRRKIAKVRCCPSEFTSTSLAVESFRFEASNDAFSTWDKYEAGLRSDFEQALGEHRKRIEASARADGLEKTPEKRNPDHYRWLARYQVKGESFADIWSSLLEVPGRRQKGELSRQAVRNAILDTADEIRLTPREIKNMTT